MAADITLKGEVRMLLRHGKGGARTGKEFARILGYGNDRLIRHVIRELIADGMPIASSVTPPHGYFIVSTIEEVNDYLQTLKSRLVEDAYRRRDFKRAASEFLQPGQLELWKEDAERVTGD